MSAPHANPAFTIRVLRSLVDEARKRGVDVIRVDDLEAEIAAREIPRKEI